MLKIVFDMKKLTRNQETEMRGTRLAQKPPPAERVEFGIIGLGTACPGVYRDPLVNGTGCSRSKGKDRTFRATVTLSF